VVKIVVQEVERIKEVPVEKEVIKEVIKYEERPVKIDENQVNILKDRIRIINEHHKLVDKLYA
jgi:hypothetical protein